MDTIIIIDIGSEKIASAIAAVDKQDAPPRIIGFSSSPSKGIKKSQIIDINEATRAIEATITQTERMAGQRINHATIVIGGPNIMSLNSHGVVAVNYQTSDIQEKDINRVIDSAKAVSLAANREIVHVLPKEFIVDGQGEIKNPIGMNGVRLEVNTHIVTASSIALNNTRKVCNLLGIDIDSFIFSGLASAYANLNDTEKELGCLMLDIGGGTTDISVFYDNAVIYTGVVPIGARNVTNDISAGLRISLDSAEKLKLFLFKYEKKVQQSEDKHLKKQDTITISSLRLPEKITSVKRRDVAEGIVYPRVDEIIDLVEKEIRANDLIGKIPAGIIISGGGMSTPYLRERIKERFSLPVRESTPTILGGIADDLTQPEYSALVGAILYTKDNDINTGASFNWPEMPTVFSGAEMKENMTKIISFFKNFIPGIK